MKYFYSYKFRLYPTTEQQVLLAKHFGCCRFIYNYFLAQRIQLYQNKQTSSSYNKDSSKLPKLKNEFSWLKEVNSQSLQYSVKSLQNAYNNFFRIQKEKGNKGFPKFKNKNRKLSFRVPSTIVIANNKLIIPKFLEGIHLVQHSKLEGKIKFATVSKNKTNQYFVSITVEKEIEPLPTTTKIIAFDLNVKNIVDNNNNKLINPRPEDKYKVRTKFLAQEVSRKEIGSKNREKAKLKFNKLKQYIYNVKEDYLHKLSKHIINENQVICVEDLNVTDMLKKSSIKNMPRWKQKELHRNLQDCGFYSFVNKLAYKALWYGRELIKIDQYFPSSQLCNKCGYQNKELKPYEREWTCWNCWEVNDRDHNAAENILKEGLRKRTCGIQGLAYCPDVRPDVKSGLLVG